MLISWWKLGNLTKNPNDIKNVNLEAVTRTLLWGGLKVWKVKSSEIPLTESILYTLFCLLIWCLWETSRREETLEVYGWRMRGPYGQIHSWFYSWHVVWSIRGPLNHLLVPAAPSFFLFFLQDQDFIKKLRVLIQNIYI